MNLVDLKKPFPAEAVEWRIARSGEKNGKIWAKVLAYITNRAIMDRLDEVCRPENWANEYAVAPGGGVLCGISIFLWTGEQASQPTWVTKWDGADATNIEATKGGLSGAMKRAAVQWGIGRYLYNLTEGWAEITPNGIHSAKTKEGTWFKWNPPPLPPWALPEGAPESPERPHAELQSDVSGQTEPDVEGVLGTRSESKPSKRRIEDMTDEELYHKCQDGIIKCVEDKLIDDEERLSMLNYLANIKANSQKMIEYINSLTRKINPPEQGELG